MSYAKTAGDAWSTPRTWPQTFRNIARSSVLSLASHTHQDVHNFVRCCYSHAVFPECRQSFRDWLRKLKNIGDFIDNDALIEALRVPQKGRHFHMSFDDGFANVFEVAAEELAREQIPATVFVATQLIDYGQDELEKCFRDRLSAYAMTIRLASWDQIRQSASAGIEIGSHTCTHARLSSISAQPDVLADELIQSKLVIERKTGRVCRTFAWPYGTMADIDETSFAAISAAGYQLAFSAVRGRVTPTTSMTNVPRHQVEFHLPMSHNLLWAKGYRE